MKKFIVCSLALGLAGFVHAQESPNKNVQKESTTTVTTVRDSDGEKKVVKTATTSAVQNLEFENSDSNKLNKDLLPTPIEQRTTITITAPDGSTRVVDKDRSAKYTVNGQEYQVELDNVGYSIVQTSNRKKVGVLRHLGYNTYLVDVNGKHAYATFDEQGNLTVQRYDAKEDRIIQDTYTKQ